MKIIAYVYIYIYISTCLSIRFNSVSDIRDIGGIVTVN